MSLYRNASAGLIADCLHCVFQKIDNDLWNEILVCMEDQVGGNNLCMESNMITRILVPGQFDHSFDECFQIKQRRLRSRDTCEFSVRFDKRKQAFAGGTDSLQAMADFFVFIFHHGQKCIT